jgi:mono/diheme cytochrome c family protein
MRALACAALLLAVGACRTEQTIVTPDPHLERMLDQAKAMPYGTAPLLPEGMTMQRAPDGTLPFDTVLGPSLLLEGTTEVGAETGASASSLASAGGRPRTSPGSSPGSYADRVPIPIDRPLLERGRQRFEVFCATCHGILGDGASTVAGQMALRRPPSLLVPPASTDPIGEVYQTIVQGYGLMPSYRVQLSVTDAWAVVAYLKALRLAQHARVADLPPDVREQLAQEAPCWPGAPS